MSLLGNIAGSLLGNALGGGGGAGGGGGNQLMQLASSLIMGNGGIDGLIGKFTQAGLGNQVNSWVSTGANQPISGAQLSQALGPDQIAQLAQQAGMQPQQAANGLAQLLPSMVDKLTPDGKSVGGGALESALGGLLKGGGGGLGLGDLMKLFK